MPVRSFYARLAERVTPVISDPTDDGFVFRIDLRLRPMGTSGAVVHSVENALTYYEAYGRTWERSALIKARPVAGAHEVGDFFLRAVEPFVFRRYLDFSTVEDMKEMKRRIDEGLGPGGERETNVKLGAGGIREIEFIVQTLQLVNGGRDPRLRARGTQRALGQLALRGHLPEEERARLGNAYDFLRRTEHAIQIREERQSHVLPTGEARLGLVARGVGYRAQPGSDPLHRFREDLARHRGAVQEIFRDLFHGASTERDRRVRTEIRELFDRADDPEAVRELLGEIGFGDVEQAARTLLVLREGPPRGFLTRQTRERLARVAPASCSPRRWTRRTPTGPWSSSSASWRAPGRAAAS